MQHFVIIRFNFQPDDKYLDIRKRMLYELSMHSLKRQTNKNFRVAVITDLPDIDCDILIKPRSKQTPLICPGLIAQLPAYHQPDEFVLTTRLDMDDVLLPEFVEAVQSKFIPHDKLVIDVNGYNYDSRNDKMVINKPRHPSNFLTFVEYGESPKYCYHLKHPQMRCYKTIKIKEPLRIFCFHSNSMLMSRFKPGVYTKGTPVDIKPFRYYTTRLKHLNHLMKERMAK